MMGETFAQDGYAGGLSPLVQQQMAQFRQRRRPGAMPGGMPQQQPGGGIAPQIGRAGGAPGDAGTGGMQSAFNAASGFTDPSTGRTGLGGNLGAGGTFDPSNWNTSLPSGDLFGGM